MTTLEELNQKYDCSLALTCPACPVQVEGQLFNGEYLYFRERWGEWAIGIGEDANEAVEREMSQFPFDNGFNDHTPSWMPMDAVCEVLDKALDFHTRRYWKWIEEAADSLKEDQS